MKQGDDQTSRLREWLAFLFITAVLVPLLTIMAVAGYGFIVWMLQVFVFGPPGHGDLPM